MIFIAFEGNSSIAGYSLTLAIIITLFSNKIIIKLSILSLKSIDCYFFH